MPTYNSPFATSFNSSVNRGVSYNVAVSNIAKKNNKTTDFVWNSLYKAGCCYRQKFNSQWVYFPCNVVKNTATTNKSTQYNCWQLFCEWAITTGHCTPETLKNNSGSQKEFMTYCRKFWSKQYTASTTTSKTTTKRGSYKFPTSKKTTRWNKKAA